VRYFGAVSISIPVAKRLTPLKTAHMIDPAYFSNITLENLSLTKKQKIVVRARQSLIVQSWALIIWWVVASKNRRKQARPVYYTTFPLSP
jgi:hypothetical protein